MSRKKKKRLLTTEELEQLAALPIRSLPVDRMIIKRLGERRYTTVGKIAKASPRKLMIECLIGEEDIFLIAAALRELYRDSLPNQWYKGALRRDVRYEAAAPKLSRGPEIEASVWGRFVHRVRAGKHYKKPRKKGLL